jgi:hypothetical protein
MKTAKSAPAAFKFDATVKAALATLGDRDGQSMANVLEWLIRKQCERDGLGWPPLNWSPSGEPKGRPEARRKPASKRLGQR